MAAASSAASLAAAVTGGALDELVHRSIIAPPSESGHPGQPTAIIVLNNVGEDSGSSLFLRSAWHSASLRLCADGGANSLYDSLGEQNRSLFLPDMVVGDLDSLRPEVADYYRDSGAAIVKVSDQDRNDFEKCLQQVLASAGAAARDTTVVALGAFGGRFDQEMAAFHLLYQYTHAFRRFVLLGGGNVSFLLLPDRRHRIVPDPRMEGPFCGLLPIGNPCGSVTTSGLMWDLHQQPLAFGGRVSSSNRIAAAEVEVVTDAPVVWTMSFGAATVAAAAATAAAAAEAGEGDA
ncbi:thiamine pyrophosphokinase [Tribonema minus]|uniref:Thiamine pyrophosphokinase n=1 Tax=Tribonema minus TaxID=303371 RepID=A0A836CNJ4_9STRA|nr:thiamine pyrophosphokinase [Tribonema minus]